MSSKQFKIMNYRIAKKGETTHPRYEVGGAIKSFPRSHKGLEKAIALANELETFVVAFSVDCSTETVWTHESIDALHAAEMLNHYK